MKSFTLIKRFAPYFKKYKAILIIDLICAALTTLCDIALPLIVRHITDAGLNDAASLTVRTVLLLGALYIFLRIIDSTAGYYMTNIGHRMGVYIETDMRQDLFEHIQKLPCTYFDNNKIGQLISRLTTDLFDVTEFAHHCPEEYFIAFIKFAACVIILCGMNPLLTLLIFIMIPIMILVCCTFNRRMKRTFRESREQTGDINANAEDSLLGIRVVKSFASEEAEGNKFSVNNEKFRSIKKRMYSSMAGFHTTIRIFDGLMYIGVVVVGALFMINSKLYAADLVAFLMYVTTLLATVRRIVEFTEQFQRGITGIERFVQIMDEPVEQYRGKELENVKGDIRFENVEFRYSEHGKTVLQNLNLHIKAGDNVALVGPSGGGKTTICNLIPRFYEINAGKIYVDEIDTKEISLSSLRSNVGIVQQDVYLFSGTVLENIRYGSPDASYDEIIAAAKNAGAHDFIMSLEHGYDTYVGERGVKLSGGQKQRISIARVFLKNPPILILDEATSALDNESERIVQASLDRLARGRTTFTIAHRLTTVKNASIILVLTDKGIVESGTHKELMELGGVYSTLYGMYTEG